MNQPPQDAPKAISNTFAHKISSVQIQIAVLVFEIPYHGSNRSKNLIYILLTTIPLQYSPATNSRGR